MKTLKICLPETSRYDVISRIEVIIRKFFIFSYRQLSNNKITRIESEAFYGVVAGSIDFQNNSLRELQTYSFKDVQLTETLNLNELQFTDIPTKAFYNVFARNIDLSSSGINTIQTEAFFNVTLMEDL